MTCAVWLLVPLAAWGLQPPGVPATRVPQRQAARRQQQIQEDLPPPKVIAEPPFSRDLLNLWYPLLPLAPYAQRKTIVEEIVKDEIWAFDQLQGIFYVQVPVRMIVVKVSDGLMAYAPNAPTKECLRELRKLEAEHGSVKHIVLPTQGVEHKAFFGQFCWNFPKADVWYTPGQYSFPVNYTNLDFLGLRGRAKELPRRGTDVIPGIDVATLGPIRPKGPGGFGESALYHKKTRSLLVVDVVVKVPRTPPAIVTYDPRPVMFHARDDISDVVDLEDEATRNKGWRRLALFAFFFQPAAVEVVPFPEFFIQAQTKCRMKNIFGWFNLYPFEWNSKLADKDFETLARPKLFVAPILQELILNRGPEPILDWLNDVLNRFNFVRIIPCHLATSIPATPNDLKSAFNFLYSQPQTASQFPDDDLRTLRDVEISLIKLGTIYPRFNGTIASEIAARPWRPFSNLFGGSPSTTNASPPSEDTVPRRRWTWPRVLFSRKGRSEEAPPISSSSSSSSEKQPSEPSSPTTLKTND